MDYASGSSLAPLCSLGKVGCSADKGKQALVGVSPKGLAEPKAQMLQRSAQCNETGADAECAEGADGWLADGADGRPQGQHSRLLHIRSDGNAGDDQANSRDHPPQFYVFAVLLTCLAERNSATRVDAANLTSLGTFTILKQFSQEFK